MRCRDRKISNKKFAADAFAAAVRAQSTVAVAASVELDIRHRNFTVERELNRLIRVGLRLVIAEIVFRPGAHTGIARENVLNDARRAAIRIGLNR